MPRTKVKIPFFLKVIPKVFPVLEKLAPFLAYRFAAKIFLTPFRYKTPEAEKEFVKTGNRFEIEIEEKKVVGFTWGEGKTIVCVHGWSGRGSMFRKFVEPLVAEGFKVVTFDGPGHGLSDGISTDVLEFEKVLLHFEEQFNPVVGFVTHSFGGTATLFTISRNTIAKPTVLIAVPAIGEQVIKTFRERINGSRKLIKKIEEITFQKYGQSFYEISGIRTATSLGDTPALVIHDSNDKDVPVEHGDKLMESLSNGTFIRTTGLGHNRILKDPYVIGKTVEFLSHHCQ